MVLALGIEHTIRALNAQNALDEMTNEMFRRNAETLKQGAIDAAMASERSVVDVETLRKVNADIITSINEVYNISFSDTVPDDLDQNVYAYLWACGLVSFYRKHELFTIAWPDAGRKVFLKSDTAGRCHDGSGNRSGKLYFCTGNGVMWRQRSRFCFYAVIFLYKLS